MSDELHPIRILVLDRGFVFVCRCPDPEGFGFWLPVTHSRTIRIWGTTEGLGELVNGPTASTKLDAMVMSAKHPVRAVLSVLDVEQSKWEQYLSASGTTRTARGSSARTGMTR